MVLRPQNRERGLTAFNEARQVRRRAIVFGRVRVREVATRFWILTFIGLAVFGVVYYRYSEVKLSGRRHEVRAQQRAVVAVVGAEALGLRDKLEGWVKSLAESAPADRVVSGLSIDAISRSPGIYLRLMLADAHDVVTMRRKAQRSLRDGFTSCLFVGRQTDPKQGTACETTSRCGPGELCNEWNVCAAPTQPYNLRLLYDAAHVLTPEWDAALDAAENDMQVRAIELDLEDTAKHEVPAALNMVKTSKYFTVVLDEPLAEEAKEPVADETPEQRLQAEDHFVRVGIWDIQAGDQLLSLRLEAAGRYVAVGQRRAKSLDIERAQRRQANNCALGTQVKATLSSGRIGASDDSAIDEPARDLMAGE